MPASDSIGKYQNDLHNPLGRPIGKPPSNESGKKRFPYFPLDTIEVIEVRMAREIEKGQKFFSVFVSRLLILSFIIPPYFVFYRGPRFVIHYSFPYLWKLAESGGQLVVKLYGYISAWDVDLSKFFTRLAQKMFRFRSQKRSVQLEQKFKALVNRIAVKVEAFREGLKTFEKYRKNLNRKIAQTFQNSYMAVQPFFLRCYSLSVQSFSRVAVFANKALVHINKAQAVLKTVIKNINLKLNTALPRIKIKGRFDFQKIKAFIGQNIQPIKNFFPNIVVPIWKQFIDVSENAWKGFRKSLNPSIRAISQVSHRIVDWTKFRVHEGMQIGNQLKQTVSARTGQFLRKVAGKWDFRREKYKELIERARNKIKFRFTKLKMKIIPILKRSYERSKQKFLKWKAYAKATSKKVGRWLFEQLILLPSRIKRFLTLLKSWMVKALKKAKYTCIVSFAWTKVVIRHTINNLWVDNIKSAKKSG